MAWRLPDKCCRSLWASAIVLGRGEGEKIVQWRDLLVRAQLKEDDTLARESLDYLLTKVNARQS